MSLKDTIVGVRQSSHISVEHQLDGHTRLRVAILSRGPGAAVFRFLGEPTEEFAQKMAELVSCKVCLCLFDGSSGGDE